MWKRNSSELSNYREPRKNILKINLLLLWAIFMCFLMQQVFSIFLLFFHKRPDVQHTTLKMMFSHSEQNWKNLIQKQSFADVLQNRCSKNFANFTGKHSCWSLFLKRLQVEALQHYQYKTLTQVFSCEVCKIF